MRLAVPAGTAGRIGHAVLCEGSPEDADAVVEADFEAWIAEHPADLGLAAELTFEDIELHPLAAFRSAARPLAIFCFVQAHHGVPMLAPDGIVRWR